MRQTSDKRGLLLHGGVLLGYLVLSIALTWPLLAYWNTGVVGVHYGFEDASQNIWNMWWTRHALERGQNPFWTPLLYYPDGVQLYVQTFNIFSNIVTLPVQYLANQIAAFNTAVLLACVLTGYGGFLLVRHFVPGMAIPFLCGALLTACPFHLMKVHVSQLNLMNLQWLPLYVLALLRLNRTMDDGQWSMLRSLLPFSLQPSAFNLLFAVAIFVLATLTDWYWALICGIYTVIWFGISFARSYHRWLLLRRYTLFGVGVLICLMPLFVGIALVRDGLPTIQNSTVWAGYVRGYSSDVLGLFLPSALHPLWGRQVEQAISVLSPGYATEGWYIAAGWVLLSLAALGVWRSWRAQWPLLVAGGVLWLLTLGPTLRIAGFDTGLPTPYTLLQHVPLLRDARRPSHLAAMCIVIATVFAGIGLQHLYQRLLGSRQRVALLIGISVLALIELWPPPRDLFTFEQPAVFQQVRAVPGAVADLPLEWTETSRSLRHQMIHGQPVLGSYVARRPTYDTYATPLLHQIGSMAFVPDIVPTDPVALRTMQCAYPVRHAIVQKELTTARAQQELVAVITELNGVPLQPRFEDARFVWYELPLFPNACAPFVYLGSGWHATEMADAKRWRWSTDASDIWAVNPSDTAIPVRLDIATDSFAFPRPVALWNDERHLAAWAVGDIPRRMSLVVHLKPGANRLVLQAEAWWDSAGERFVSAPVTAVSLQPLSSGVDMAGTP